MIPKQKAFFLRVTGLVQGVGFRPFVYRISQQHGLSGWVRNTNECVEIFVQGAEQSLERFFHDLESHPPPAARVRDILRFPEALKNETGFIITRSENQSDRITEISPDIAVCEECLQDMQHQTNRVHYPFINCTHCGPRFTIINDLPYDRKNTSMKPFPMCDSCRKEYENVNDRRFHAQPVACSVCGPHYSFITKNDRIESVDAIMDRLAGLLLNGGIVAIKGLGGYHLACDATNEAAVGNLRLLKNREGKPLAVMFPDPATIRKYAEISEAEEKSLLSWKRPIVLLESNNKNHLASGVNVGLNLTGAMLPYLPFHYLLFDKLKIPAIVLTSGNISDEPILIDDAEAIRTFLDTTDGLLVYNRKIENRTDDSVVRIMSDAERVFRRSRGMTPSPVTLPFSTEGILATGAELVNTFCIGKGSQAILSQHIGDLQNTETTSYYEETLGKFQRLFRMKPERVVSDLHPDYFTSRFAARQEGLEHFKVQHHHAHIASCMAEHGLDEHVIGVAMDGTGYGTDGNIWGAEFLYCDLADFERFSHFEYMPLPGGDRGIEEPWRMAVSYLFSVYGDEMKDLDLPFVKGLDKDKLSFILNMISSGTNSPLVSSAGRLFDAVAALLGLCGVATFPAEAPMRLESIVMEKVTEQYPFILQDDISFEPMIRAIVEDLASEIDPGIIAAKFHNSVISVIFEVVKKMKVQYHCNKVVLSGGTFQNKYLLEGVERLLERTGFEVSSHRIIPANDGGIALGQIAIAAKRKALSCV
ncbi:MAG: carbamoyltransferase HypF [Bacteroidetes bacterium]|nr:carbamoyltransferase HypF [Bacteroidota bacterium]